MTSIEDIKQASQIYAKFFNKDPDTRSQLSINIEKEFTCDKNRSQTWVKKRIISAHHLSYNELMLILSYCDIETTVSLLDIRDHFVYNANILSIKTNLAPFTALLESTPNYYEEILASGVFSDESCNASSLMESLNALEEQIKESSGSSAKYQEVM